MATSVTQYGITWTFDDDYTVGQYANGDYYVVDSGSGVGITNISPGYQEVDTGRYGNGSMINPVPGKVDYQGLDDAAVDYVASLNVGINLPLTIEDGESLVSTISLVPIDHTHIETAAILTCVSAVPSELSFRPHYSATGKVTHAVSDTSKAGLLSVATPGTSIPALATLEAMVSGPWIDFGETGAGVQFHPQDHMQWYGRDIGLEVSQIACALNCDEYTLAERDDLFNYFVQLGIDLYGLALNGRQWEDNGGYSQGRKWPIMFAGQALGNSDMQDLGDDTYDFTEDITTFYVSQTDVDRGVGYTSAMLEMPEWGINHGGNANNDDPDWTTSYRSTQGQSWAGYILACCMQKLKSSWGHDELFNYMERYMAIADGEADPFGYTVPNEGVSSRGNQFVQDMWDTFWATYRSGGTGEDVSDADVVIDTDGSEDYSSWDAWVTAQGTTAFTGDTTVAFYGNGGDDTSPVDMGDLNLNGYKLNLIFDSSYRIAVDLAAEAISTAIAWSDNTSSPNVLIDGLKTLTSGHDGSYEGTLYIELGATCNVEIRNSDLREEANINRGRLLRVGSTGGNYYIHDNFIVMPSSNTDSRSTPISLGGAPGSTKIINNTIIGDATGTPAVYRDEASTAYATLKMLNNIVQDCGPRNGSAPNDADYNMVSEAWTFGGTNDAQDVTFDFIGDGDYHLSDDDTGAANKGLGVEIDSDVALVDFDGDERSGSTCNAGADEYASETPEDPGRNFNNKTAPFATVDVWNDLEELINTEIANYNNLTWTVGDKPVWYWNDKE